MKKYIFQEIICSMILGGIPCFLVVVFYDVESLVDFVGGLAPPDIITYYFVALLFLHTIIWAVQYFFLQKTEVADKAIKTLHSISDQVGFSLLGLYRAIVGSLLIYLPPIMFVEPTIENFVYLVLGCLLALAGLFVCCLLREWSFKTSW